MKKKKFIALILSVTAFLCSCGVTGGSESSSETASEPNSESHAPSTGVPTFEDYEIIFNAYASVPTSLMNEEQFQNLKDAGFRKATGLYEGRVGLSEGMTETELDAKLSALKKKSSEDANKALALGEKYGIEYYVFNELLYNIERYTDKYDKYISNLLSDEAYTSSAAYAGHFFADEPNQNELKSLVAAVKAYKKYDENGEPFINLLPCESKSSKGNYIKYLDYYFENLATELGYISYDHYPYAPVSGIDEMHLWNLEEVCERAKTAGIDVRGFIWSNLNANEYHRGITSAADLRLQIYTNLAYGVDDMAYFVYSSNGDTSNKTGALINYRTGKKSNAYIWAKAVHNEVLAFEDVYGAFAWKGAMTFGDNKQFAELTRTLSSVDRIKSVDAEKDTLIGVFEDKDGEYECGASDAFMVVNYGDPLNAKGKSKTTIEFVNATRAMICKNGEVGVVTLENGKLELETAVGDGVFIVPLA